MKVGGKADGAARRACGAIMRSTIAWWRSARPPSGRVEAVRRRPRPPQPPASAAAARAPGGRDDGSRRTIRGPPATTRRCPATLAVGSDPGPRWAARAGGDRTGCGDRAPAHHAQMREGPMRIFVGNLTSTTTAEDLQRLFAPYGLVNFVRIVPSPQTGRSLGYGFVEMPNVTEA